jgi:hypothetical protein
VALNNIGFIYNKLGKNTLLENGGCLFGGNM